MSPLLFFLFCILFSCGVEGQNSVDTTISFDFSNTVPKVYNCPNGPPRLPNDTLVQISLGGLGDLTGAVDASGPLVYLAWQIAVKELNDLFRAISAPFFVTLQVQDTRGDPATALTKITQLVSQGNEVFVGPLTSGEIVALQSYVADNDLTLISPTSTADSLAVPDTIFRLSAPDSNAANALALYIARRGLAHVIVLYTQEVYGQSFATVLQSSLSVSSNATVTLQGYPVTSPNFNALLSAASAVAAAAKGTVGVVVISVSTNDWKSLFNTGALSGFPALTKAVWMGEALDTSGLPSAVSAQLQLTEFVFQDIYIPTTDLTQALTAAFTSLLVNSVPAEAFQGYDSLYVAVFSYILSRRGTATIYDQALALAGSNLFLTTGRAAFDANGDKSLDITYGFSKFLQGTLTVYTTYSSTSGFTDLNP